MKRIVSITEQIIEEMAAEKKSREPIRKTTNCLVVEDDENDADLTSMALTAMGVEVAVANNVTKAIELLKLSKDPLRPDYDIVFVDLKFPGGPNGIELLRHMKREFPKVHTVIVSGHVNVAELNDFFQDGGRYVGIISKPLERMDVKEILEKHRMTAQ